MNRLKLVGILTLAFTVEAQAQRLPDRPPTFDATLSAGIQAPRPAPYTGSGAADIAAPVAGGVLFGAAGLFAGAMIGSQALGCRWSGLEDCGLLEGFFGAAIGESIMLPLGAHLFSRHRGNVLADVGVSLMVGATGVLMTVVTGSPAPLLVVPVAQLAAVIATDRATRRR